MASIKVILRNKKNKDNTQSIALQILKNRRQSVVHIGHSVEEKYWDFDNCRVKKSYPNSARLNNLILKKLSEANDKLMELEAQKADTTSNAIRKVIKFNGNSLFVEQASLYLDTLKKAGKYTRYTPDKSRIERFKDFLKVNDLGSDIAFSEITPQLLKRFQGYLKAKKISDRTIVNYLIVIRTIFNQTIAANLVDRKYYPFGKGKIIIKTPDTIKIGLTMEEVNLLEKLILPEDSFEHHCRNLWLFSFYFAGMRISDVFRMKWSDLQDGRLHYAMGKNDKGGSLKIPEKALTIIQQYKKDQKSRGDFIFPELKEITDRENDFLVQRRIMNMTSRVDKTLRKKVAPMAGITKKLTMHIARHTFGNISGEKISLQMLQKLYRHSDIKTTMGYQKNFTHKDADEALDAVING